MFSEELRLFRRFLKANNLKQTSQREAVLEVFLRTEKHLSVEELYHQVRRTVPGVSQPTVFRTLKLLVSAGLARTMQLDDRVIRYEHNYRHEHHDHLVCEHCARIIEVRAPALEKLQERLCRENGFRARYHRLKIYGACRCCSVAVPSGS